MRTGLIYFQDGFTEPLTGHSVSTNGREIHVKDKVIVTTAEFEAESGKYLYTGELIGEVGSNVFKTGAGTSFLKYDPDEDMWVPEYSIRYVAFDL